MSIDGDPWARRASLRAPAILAGFEAKVGLATFALGVVLVASQSLLPRACSAERAPTKIWALADIRDEPQRRPALININKPS